MMLITGEFEEKKNMVSWRKSTIMMMDSNRGIIMNDFDFHVFANAIKHNFKSKNPTTRWSDIIRQKGYNYYGNKFN